MKREPVDSSSITSVGYAADTNLLEVEFRHGARYQYFAVPRPTFDAFMAAHFEGRLLQRANQGPLPVPARRHLRG